MGSAVTSSRRQRSKPWYDDPSKNWHVSPAVPHTLHKTVCPRHQRYRSSRIQSEAQPGQQCWCASPPLLGGKFQFVYSLLVRMRQIRIPQAAKFGHILLRIAPFSSPSNCAESFNTYNASAPTQSRPDFYWQPFIRALSCPWKRPDHPQHEKAFLLSVATFEYVATAKYEVLDSRSVRREKRPGRCKEGRGARKPNRVTCGLKLFHWLNGDEINFSR